VKILSEKAVFERPRYSVGSDAHQCRTTETATTPTLFTLWQHSLAYSAALCGVSHKLAPPEHVHFPQKR